MSPTEKFGKGAGQSWVIRLDCGHDITLPLGSGAPVATGCIVHHQSACEGTAPSDSPSWVPTPVLIHMATGPTEP